MDVQTGAHLRASLIQVQRPLLPRLEALHGYLEQIDGNRWYTNRGKLVWSLELRLSQLIGSAAMAVGTLSSGTAAIAAAILATAGRAQAARPLALMPSYTFVATAQAAIQCGYRPHFLDVDPETWMLCPEAVAAHPLLAEAGLVLPVAAFGRAPDMRAWERLRGDTGLAVVVDAAAAIERFVEAPGLVSATVPAAISLHATKFYSAAEGGAVLWADPEGLLRMGHIANFGMLDSRECVYDGFNGKLSEYHAAVGLACLDEWEGRRARARAIAAAYRAGADALPGRIWACPDISAAYVAHDAPTPALSAAVERRLKAAGIGVRRWYGPGLHRQPAFAGFGSDPMPATEALAACHLGLPAALDLEAGEIAAVLAAAARKEGERCNR